MGTQPAAPEYVKDLDLITRSKICKTLNIQRVLGCDYITLGGLIGMTVSDVRIISGTDNPTEELLRYWEIKSEATIPKLREVLLNMKRDDIVEVLDNRRGAGDSEAYQSTALEALNDGEKKNNRISLLLIGAARAGKTSLKKSLAGEKTKEYQESTTGIEYDVFEVNEKDKSKPWKRAADGQHIASKKYTDDIIANETARKILEKQNNSGRNGSQEGEKGGTNGDKSVKNVVGTSSIQSSTENQYEYPISEELIAKARENVKNYRDDIFDTIRFMVGDVAGQSMMYDVHSIMLRFRTVFILVIDLTESLFEEAKPKFLNVGETKETCLPNPLHETNLDYLTRLMAALRNLNPCDKPTTKENTVESLSGPKTIVVFTKPDKLRGDADVELMRKKATLAIHQRFHRIGCSDLLVVPMYVIRNTEPRNAKETKDLECLQETIYGIAKGLLGKQDRNPINWLVLERLFDIKRREANKTDNPCITFKEAKKLGEQCNVKEKFDDAMKFFHEENIVFHCPGNSNADDLVVLSPAWLVKLFAKVIGVVPSDLFHSPQLLAWHDLQEGKLNFDKLHTVLTKHGAPLIPLKIMMDRAGLICHWRENIYLVPSMVTKSKDEKKIKELLNNQSQPSLFLDFKDEPIPLGFYTRFVVELLIWAGIEDLQLFCNFMRVRKTDDTCSLRYSVALIRHISRIEIVISIHAKNEMTDVDVAKKVLSTLSTIMEKIQSANPSFKGMRYKFGMKCDLCSDEMDDPCERHNGKNCSNGDCVHVWDLEKLKKQLDECEKNILSSCRKSKLHETWWVKATGHEEQRPSHSEDEATNKTTSHQAEKPSHPKDEAPSKTTTEIIFHKRIGKCSDSVGMMTLKNKSDHQPIYNGTVWLVAKEESAYYFMTNYHVSKCIEQRKTKGKKIVIQFNYETKAQANCPEFEVSWQNVLCYDKVLDYAIFKINSPCPCGEYLAINRRLPNMNSEVFVIGHPKCETKKTMSGQVLHTTNGLKESVENTAKKYCAPKNCDGSNKEIRCYHNYKWEKFNARKDFLIAHNCQTNYGASGSPMVNGNADVLGMHTWGMFLGDKQQQEKPAIEFAHAIKFIMDDIENKNAQLAKILFKND